MSSRQHGRANRLEGKAHEDHRDSAAHLNEIDARIAYNWLSPWIAHHLVVIGNKPRAFGVQYAVLFCVLLSYMAQRDVFVSVADPPYT